MSWVEMARNWVKGNRESVMREVARLNSASDSGRQISSHWLGPCLTAADRSFPFPSVLTCVPVKMGLD